MTLWAYNQTHSAFAVSLMTFCNYVPYIILSLFAGSFVDRHSKKAIMLIVNAIVGCSNAFQQPASSVAVFRLVPEEKLEMVSGMNSFSMNLVTIASPVLAAFCYGVFGMGSVLLIDIVSFMAAFLVLLFLIKIEEEKDTVQKTSLFSGTTQGWQFLWKNRGLLVMMLTMAAINFFSRLTYENILSPMILARSGENNMVLGLVNAAMGIGGIADGIIVTMKKETKNRVRMMSGAPIVPIGKTCRNRSWKRHGLYVFVHWYAWFYY